MGGRGRHVKIVAPDRTSSSLSLVRNECSIGPFRLSQGRGCVLSDGTVRLAVLPWRPLRPLPPPLIASMSIGSCLTICLLSRLVSSAGLLTAASTVCSSMAAGAVMQNSRLKAMETIVV